MDNEKLKIEYVDIKKIKPNQYNPKNMTPEEEIQLKTSIEEFGQVDYRLSQYVGTGGSIP